RTWGWAVQLYALRSGASWGMGDLADLRELGSWSAERGAGMVLLNPLHAPLPGTPQEPSPYYPSSRCWRSPIYIRVEEVPGAAGPAVDLERLAAAGRALNGERRIDRDAVWALKLEALERAWDRFTALSSDRDGLLGSTAHEAFALGARVGAPPDEFNTAGQDWGVPPFDPWRLRLAWYEPFVQTLRSALRHSAGLRVDHVMGLTRLFWIPPGGGPGDGTYVRYPA